MKPIQGEAFWAGIGRLSLLVGVLATFVGLGQHVFEPKPDVQARCADYSFPAGLIPALTSPASALPLAIRAGATQAGIADEQMVNRLQANIEAKYRGLDITTVESDFYQNLTNCEVENLGKGQAEDVRIRFWGAPRVVVIDSTISKANENGVVEIGKLNSGEKKTVAAFSFAGEFGLGELTNKNMLTAKSGRTMVDRGTVFYGSAARVAWLFAHGWWFVLPALYLLPIGVVSLVYFIIYGKRTTVQQNAQTNSNPAPGNTSDSKTP